MASLAKMNQRNRQKDIERMKKQNKIINSQLYILKKQPSHYAALYYIIGWSKNMFYLLN